jgi:hypothetical protein
MYRVLHHLTRQYEVEKIQKKRFLVKYIALILSHLSHF